jgi:hypothetical protein
MAELGSTGSDNDNEIEDDDDDLSNSDNINGKMNDKQNNNHIDDVDDDELERLARINAKFNTKNLDDNSLKPKGANFVLEKKRLSILKEKESLNLRGLILYKSK